MKKLLIFLIFLFVMLVAVAVGAQNDQWIQVNYIIASSQMHVATLMALSIGLGFILALSLSGLVMLRLSWHNKHLQRRLKRLSHANEQK
ncbi:LapA family protein [Bowmanella sp. JS7-9]|uniref:LapA family protein n=1 Tax=Pseudobowmanella zhangzhouensis TaxID=1537679 RepID=A0ABW1XN05_9ALTE|nr:lipopolysaccharide assembly protein LapA domain-containing protein [Bowmanella sp. JS7-9]TBX27499.1 hypothetical protein TK45_01815 [Bowmanella sp. JS7-9]